MGQSQPCPSCRTRKPKRACPALGATICTVCCATKREVEIACPPDCVYLSTSRSHPPAIVQKRQERDASLLLPLVSDLTETQFRLLLLLQSAIVRHALGSDLTLRDEDVADGVSAAAATLETAGKGIIYEHQAVSVPAQRLTLELNRVIAELRADVGSQQARLERDAAAALRRLERGAQTAAQVLKGDEHPVFLNVLARMTKPETGRAATADEGQPSKLIITP